MKTRPTRTSLAKRRADREVSAPTAYIMVQQAGDHIRVGHHTQTNKLREGQVKRGQGDVWKVLKCYRYDHKLTALAVEYLAHAYLRRRLIPHAGSSGQKTFVFDCSSRTAVKALDKAHRAVRAALGPDCIAR